MKSSTEFRDEPVTLAQIDIVSSKQAVVLNRNDHR